MSAGLTPVLVGAQCLQVEQWHMIERKTQKPTDTVSPGEFSVVIQAPV